MFILTGMRLQYRVHPFLCQVAGCGCEVQVSVFTMLLHGPVRDDPGPGLIIFMEQRRPVRLIVFYWREPVGEICLIKRSDAKSDINHGKVETPAL